MTTLLMLLALAVVMALLVRYARHDHFASPAAGRRAPGLLTDRGLSARR